MTGDAALSVEERLRASLNEVAECVTVDSLPPVWSDDDLGAPRPRRTRALVAAGIAIALAIGTAIAVSVAASNSGSPHGAPVANSTPRTSALFVNEGPLRTRRVYRGGKTTLLPPRSTHPKVTASQAYAARSSYPWRREPPQPHLVLADATVSDYGNLQSNGTVKPIIDNRLVWVVTYADPPVGSFRPTSGPAPRRGFKVPVTAPEDPSRPSGATVLVFVDATTGKAIEAEGFPGSFTTSGPTARTRAD